MMTTEETITDHTTTDADKYPITILWSEKKRAAKNVPNGMERKIGLIAAKPMSPYSRFMCTITLFFQVNFFFGFEGLFLLHLAPNLLSNNMMAELR